MTAATTRMVCMCSEIDPEQLLPHQQDVPWLERLLVTNANERAVRAADVRERHRPVRLLAHPAVQPRNVPVFGEQDVPALAPAVHPALRDRERVARRVPP